MSGFLMGILLSVFIPNLAQESEILILNTEKIIDTTTINEPFFADL